MSAAWEEHLKWVAWKTVCSSPSQWGIIHSHVGNTFQTRGQPSIWESFRDWFPKWGSGHGTGPNKSGQAAPNVNHILNVQSIAQGFACVLGSKSHCNKFLGWNPFLINTKSCWSTDQNSVSIQNLSGFWSACCLQSLMIRMGEAWQIGLQPGSTWKNPPFDSCQFLPPWSIPNHFPWLPSHSPC